MDPLRYVDLQLAVLEGLVEAKKSRIKNAPFDPKNKALQDSRAFSARTDEQSFKNAERNVKDALDKEARNTGLYGPGRQSMLDDRYRQLAQFQRDFK
jgi:hypothetical protein